MARHGELLIEEKQVPRSLMVVEMSLTFNEMQKRCDIAVFNRDLKPVLIAECKAPSVKITQDSFDQIARYNMALKVNYLLVSNGGTHYCCKINHEKRTYKYLDDLPGYNEM